MASVLTSITLGALCSIFRDIIIALQYCQHFFAQNLALCNKDKSLFISSPMCDRFPRKFDVQISYNICCEHQISLDNLSHDSAFDTRTLLFK